MSNYLVNRNVLEIFLAAVLSFYSVMVHVDVIVLGEQNFDAGVIPKTDEWGFGAQDGGQISISKDTAANFNGSAGSLKGYYPVPTGGMYVWGGFDISSHNINDVYISFWAKMPNAKHGLKFLKVFGQREDTNSGMNISNTTFGLDYTGVDYGAMYCVSFGDGSGEANDTQNIINFDGSYPKWIGRSSGVAIVNTPKNKLWAASNWGNTWHHFRIHIKYNSGTSPSTEVADGEYYVEIDGQVYVDARKIFNRHYSNKPIQKISFFDWSQTGKNSFEIWYDDIKITTGGFYDKNPVPPIKPTLIIK